jgi:hypothetical protein
MNHKNQSSDNWYKPVEHKLVECEKPEALMDKVMMLEEEIVHYVRTFKKEI